MIKERGDMEEIKKDEIQEETPVETCECEETCTCEEADTCECEDSSLKGKFLKKKENKEIEKLNARIAELEAELAKAKNDYYMAYADTQNMRKRLQNDADMIRKYRIQGFAADILPAIDNLERALSVVSENEEVKNYMNGINMVYQQIMNALTNEGVSVIEAKDKPFDPKVHQALVMEKVEGVESGIVLEEIQKGYMLKDRVLRATLVKVSE